MNTIAKLGVLPLLVVLLSCAEEHYQGVPNGWSPGPGPGAIPAPYKPYQYDRYRYHTYDKWRAEQERQRHLREEELRHQQWEKQHHRGAKEQHQPTPHYDPGHHDQDGPDDHHKPKPGKPPMANQPQPPHHCP